MKSKYDLLIHFAELGFSYGAEIGVSQGHFSEAMFKVIPGLDLLCVDNWEPYKGNRWGKKQQTNDEYYETAKKRLAPYHAYLMKFKSMEVVRDVTDELLDFVYIDGNHSFDYVMQDLIEWSKKVRPGGIVSGDDYYDFKGAGVIEAVDAYTKAHGIEFNLTDPLPDKIQDRGFQEQPSFWWVKQ